LAEYDDVIRGPLFSLSPGPPTLNSPLSLHNVERYPQRNLNVCRENAVINVYVHFSISANRRETLRDFNSFADTAPLEIFHHASTRWLLLLPSVMCPSHFCRVRVTSPSSQSHLRFFRVRDESQELLSHFESMVCKLESHEISHFFYDIFCYEMVRNML